MKKLSFQDNARNFLLEGSKLLADAVCTTLGPKGRNVAIQRQWGGPIVVHDGVTVAREVESKNPLVKMGVDLIRNAASKTNEEAGDGTTTATLLAYEIVSKGLKLIKDGVNPMVLRSQIYDALPIAVKELKANSSDVKGTGDIAKVATISSADEFIGKLVAEAMTKVGKDGLVTVEEGTGMKTYLDYTDGVEFKSGMLSPYFITNPGRNESVVMNPVVAIVEKKLTMANEIVPMLQAMAEVSKDIVVIADDVGGDALGTMVGSKMKGLINAVAIRSPNIGDKSQSLEDLATLVGAKLIKASDRINFANDRSYFGRAEKVITSRTTTVLIGGKGEEADVKARLQALRDQRDNEESKFEKEKLEERLARLTRGIAVIRVCAKTEVEMREKLERAKDAVGAAKSAQSEGIVTGGGTIFLQMAKALKGENEGEKLLKEVLEAPVRKLMLNGGENSDFINKTVSDLSDSDGSTGYEMMSGKVVDLIKEGIIDPTKVVRLALENAVSVGTQILTTDCLIAYDFSEAKKEACNVKGR